MLILAYAFEAITVLAPSPVYPPQRQHDQHIMDLVLKLSYTDRDTKRINAVRLYLQVTTISDISNYPGTQIQAAARTGRPNHLLSEAKWIYPAQQRPDHPS